MYLFNITDTQCLEINKSMISDSAGNGDVYEPKINPCNRLTTDYIIKCVK